MLFWILALSCVHALTFCRNHEVKPFNREIAASTPTALNGICPSFRQNVCCDDMTLLKIKNEMNQFQTECLGCKKNVEAFICHALCIPSNDNSQNLSPVFCAAGQLACGDDTFCKADGKLAELLTKISGVASSVQVKNDFSLVPLSAECEPLTKLEPIKILDERKPASRLWIGMLCSIALGAWMFRAKQPERRKARVVWHSIEPEENTRL